MWDSFLGEGVCRNLRPGKPKIRFWDLCGDTELIGKGSVGEGVGNIQLGRMNLSGKHESFRYSRSAPSIGISVCGSSDPRQTTPCALRFAWMPPILKKMRRQQSRASEVVQNTSFIGGADVDKVIPSSCRSLLFTSCRSWRFSA